MSAHTHYRDLGPLVTNIGQLVTTINLDMIKSILATHVAYKPTNQALLQRYIQTKYIVHV